MGQLFTHLFLPHHSNNHRPKILHHQSLLFLTLAMLFLFILVSFVKTQAPQILGFATDITTEELLEETNKKRQENNLPPLVLNNDLNNAAGKKAQDMFSYNYWAHNSPTGTTPWSFFASSGYKYTYAGENLARDFDYSQRVVEAWVESPTHRANLLSPNYREIGFAVVNGKLQGEDTTLVVQFFGSRGEEIAVVSDTTPKTGRSNIFGVKEKPLFDARSLTRTLTLLVVGGLILVLAIDMILAHRRRLVRVVGHNLDHIIFLGSMLILLIIEKGGFIL